MSAIPHIENPHLTRIFDPAEHVVGIRFEKLGRLYHFDYSEFPTITVGEFVIVETVRGLQMGEVVGFIEREDSVRDYKPIQRIATPRDLLIRQQWQAKEVESIVEVRDAAATIGSYKHIKFVKAEYTFDGATCTILYTAEEEENLSALKRSLQDKLQGNIEFRLIGPRDVARIMGGQGACGGPRCCSTFLTEFSPISIKMAKAQGIPLNPTEITGMCGRLRCCLLYEYEQYVEARKNLPKRNKTIGTPHGEGRVIDVYPLRDGVAVIVEDKRHFVEREDIIPLDEFRRLKEKAEAGCSKNENGGCDCGARRPKSAKRDLKAALDMAHGAVQDKTEGLPQESKPEKETSSKSGRRRRKRRSRKGKSSSEQNTKAQAKEQAPKKDAKKDDQSSSEKDRSDRKRSSSRRRRRRGNNRSNRPPKSDGSNE